jgi:hypothetical protein
MKINEKKALEILQKDFAELRVQSQLSAKTAAFIAQRAEILADRIGQLLATQGDPLPASPKPALPNGELEFTQPQEQPLTLS